MAGFIGGRTSAFDYIQPSKPANPKIGEQWLDSDDDAAKVYLGAAGWLTVAGQDDLDSVSSDLSSHSSSTGGVHGVAADDTVAGQADITAVTSSLSDHESDTTNPHNVTDDQTGAASALSSHSSSTGGVHGVAADDTVAGQADVDTVTSALSGHEDDTTNPHNVTDDQTGAATALSNHETDADAHHAPPVRTPGGTSSISTGTSYQNTTGYPLTVYAQSEYGGSISIGSSPDSLTQVATRGTNTSDTTGTLTAVVPPGWYYRASGNSAREQEWSN